MDDLFCLQELSAEMHLEPSEETSPHPLTQRLQKSVFTTQAILPNGKRISLLKSLINSICENNCYYCPFRAGRDFQRYTLSADDFAKLFMDLRRAGIVEGLFISSGMLNGSIQSQDQLLAVAEILRSRYQFMGYLHLKLMPGCEKAQVEKAMALADRVSINLEAPNDTRLQNLAPKKQFFSQLLQPLQWIQEIRTSLPPQLGWRNRWASSTTQFVVGASHETDKELLTISEMLLQQLLLSRVYYSPFRPYPDTPLEHHPPTSVLRQLRLYQASFLMRDYGFQQDELFLDEADCLPLNKDPKILWAETHLSQQPVEVNQADKQTLLRIPGIGKKGVETILWARNQHTLTDSSSLGKLGISVTRAAPFILLNGKRPIHQLSFWNNGLSNE